MPKPVKKAAKKPIQKATGKLPTPPKPKRSADPMLAAQSIMAEHMGRLGATADAVPLDFASQYKAHMAKLGAKGGKISGAARMENLSAAKRKQIAKKAAAARWGAREDK